MFNDGGHSSQHICSRWNISYANKEAFTATNRQGYKCGAVNGGQFKAHRIIWVIAYGSEPNGQIDHIDGDRVNNRLSNLRDVSNKENSRSAAIPKNNTSGFMGVSKGPKDNFRAQIKVDGRQRFLGHWPTAEAAHEAYIQARNHFGFSSRHGRSL